MGEPADAMPSRETYRSRRLGLPARLQLFELYRHYIEHEDRLINDRVGWFIQLHSFLIATYGIVVASIISTFFPQGDPVVPAVLPQYVACLMLGVIAIVGLASSLTAYWSIDAAKLAIDTLSKKWAEIDVGKGISGQNDPLPGITGGGSKTAHKRGTRFPSSLPVTLIVVWCASLLAPLAFAYIASYGPRWCTGEGKAHCAAYSPPWRQARIAAGSGGGPSARNSAR